MSKTLQDLKDELERLKAERKKAGYKKEINTIWLKEKQERQQLEKEIKDLKHFKLKQTIRNLGIIGKNIGVVGKRVMVGFDKVTNNSTNPNAQKKKGKKGKGQGRADILSDPNFQ